jgi:hypothetical protein
MWANLEWEPNVSESSSTWPMPRDISCRIMRGDALHVIKDGLSFSSALSSE